MIWGVAFAIVLVFGEMVNETKGDPSTLQATIQDGYYLGSGEGQYNNLKHTHKDHTLSEDEIKVVQDVFSPDYYEPNIILDYRYLKTGGRGYARSDGGQILILPRRKHMPNLYNDYDTLIEYLRLKHQREMNKYWRHEQESLNKKKEERNPYRETVQVEEDSYNYNQHKL